LVAGFGDLSLLFDVFEVWGKMYLCSIKSVFAALVEQYGRVGGSLRVFFKQKSRIKSGCIL
jgi:hypothetical protein